MAAIAYSDLQVVPDEHSGLQVVPGRGLEVVREDLYPKEAVDDNQVRWESTGSRILGLKRKTFWITLVVVLVLLAGALGGGIGGSLVTKGKDDDKVQETTIATPSDQLQTTESVSTSIGTSEVSTTTISIRTVVLPTGISTGAKPTATIFRDCPSSNNTIYSVEYGSEEPLLFRKYCTAGIRHDINGLDVLNEPTKSLNACIRACADYNDRNKTEIASGESQVCNAVCWRSDEQLWNINQIPGQCFGYTTVNTTAGALITDEPLCDAALWINQRDL